MNLRIFLFYLLLINNYSFAQKIKTFTSLDEVIAAPEQVQILNLSRQHLSEIPQLVLELPNLRELDLSSNLITKLPDSIGKLKQLTKLNLAGNQLTKIIIKKIKFPKDCTVIKTDLY